MEGNTNRKKKHDFSNGPVWDEVMQRWLIEVRYPDNTRRKKRTSGKKTGEAKAWKWWNAEQEKIRNGTWDHTSRLPKTTTFAKATALYLESKRNTRSFPTIRPHLKPFSQVFDNDRLAEITKDRITKIVNERLDQGIKKSAVDTDLAWLMALYNWLERTHKYLNNPTKEIKLFRENDERMLYLAPFWRKDNAFVDQFSRLVEACNKGPWFLRHIVVIDTLTGLRKGNIRELRWAWVDLSSRTLRIPTTRAKAKKTIPIPMDSLTEEPVVYKSLRDLYETRKERIYSEYIFPQLEGPHAGEPITSGQLYDAWERARIASGLERDFRETHNDSFHFHDLRHTFGSWHVMRGTDLYKLKKLMGHSNISQTERYAHLVPEDLRNRTSVSLDDAFPKLFPKDVINQDKPRTRQANGDQLTLWF